MKIKEGFVLSEVAGSYVVVNVGNELAFSGMITLNESGAFLWKKLEQGADEKQLADALVEEYGIDNKLASADTQKFLEKMKNAGIID